MRPHDLAQIALLLVGLGLATGCAPKQARPNPDLRAPDTTSRVPAIVNAAQAGDASELGELVHALSDDDPAVRLFAIQSLNTRTGQTLGYRYYDREKDRRDAIDRWHDWLAAQEASDSAADPTP